MAVMPSLATMAALTLFRNTANGDDDYWEPYAAPATTIQKIIRSYLARAHSLLGPLGAVRENPHTPLIRDNPYLALLIPWRGPLDQRSRRIKSARTHYALFQLP